MLFSCGLLENLVNGETAKKVLGQMNLWQHMDDFSKGIVDTRRLVYYASGVGLLPLPHQPRPGGEEVEVRR